jgi:DUF4097 and DUF4098 domain-containing protein YvlB
MTRTIVTTLVLAVALTTVSGNRGTAAQLDRAQLPQSVDFAAPQEGGADEVRDEFHQTYPLSANGRISLENINGGVRISVWDRNEVKVDAAKRAYRRERLDEARIEVNATADSIRIKTQYPDRDQTFTDDEGRRYNNPATVEYALTIPRRARIESIEVINGSLDIEGAEGDVKASSINGYVKAHELMGEVRLSTVNGGLEATFSRLDEAKPVSLNSVNGSVVLIIPSDANAQLRASTVHGGITNDFGLKVIDGEYVGHELNGQLGSGGVRIKLGNVNGRITVRHAGDGRTLSPATSLGADKFKDKSGKKSGEINEEANETAREAREAAREAMQTDRAARATQIQVQREVERALRDSQREVQQAQQQIQRDIQKQVRESLRDGTEGIGVGFGRGGSGRFIDRESKSFPVSGTPSVTVGTYDGPVVVRAWDKAEVSYTAIKRSNEEDSLKNISIETSQQGGAISIVAKSKDEESSTSLELYVPRNANLHVTSGDGRLSVQGVSGELLAHTGDGSIEVDGGNGRIDANTGDGRIRIVNFAGGVEARTGDGSITLEGNFNAVSARTGDGSIVLGVPADSNFTVETDAEDVSNEGLTASAETSSSKQIKRWRVGRGGTVFSLRTGDGRVILRTR